MLNRTVVALSHKEDCFEGIRKTIQAIDTVFSPPQTPPFHPLTLLPEFHRS